MYMKKEAVIIFSDTAHSLPSPFLLLPFLFQLLAIALMPFLAFHWWERHYAKASLLFGGITVLYYLLVIHAGGRLLEALHEYVSFILLLASLFVAAGGIHLGVKGGATPRRNFLFLLLGSILSSLIGTTGASMLLIRPWIRMNKCRITGFHTVFFIVLISNVGGCLTPIGDPPLFLGFLRGVPFFWPLKHLLMPWLVMMAFLLTIFYLMDRANFLRAPLALRQEESAQGHWSMEGLGNLFPLVAILVAVFLPTPWREMVMILAGGLSWYLTPRLLYQKNDFTFAPIKEVAWLFLGIFATMIPALDYLEHYADSLASSLGMGAFHFYYLTGIISSLLDNGPTYFAIR